MTRHPQRTRPAYGSRFYRRFHAGRTDRPLQELPVLTKAMVMEHFDQLVTDLTVKLADVEAHLAGAGSSCGAWTSGSPCWPPTTAPL